MAGPILRPVKNGRNKSWYECLCACGTSKDVATYYLTSGITISCGCAQREAARATRLSHGESGTRLHRIWKGIHSRTRTTGRHHQWYGAKGITVYPEWDDYLAFKNWAVANGYQDDLTIERIDATKNYEPSNCEWITGAENARRGSVATARTEKGVFTR